MDKMVGLDDDQFRLTGPKVGEPDDFVADRGVFDGAADFLDDAGEVTALSRGKRRGPLFGKAALPDHSLAGIDARSLDPDEDLPRSWDRSVDLYEVQDVDSAVFVKPYCTSHGRSP
jgi:hypothetical protein